MDELKEWIEEQLPNYTDGDPHGLSEYMASVLESELSTNDADTLAERLESKLSEFLDSRTNEFVTALCQRLQQESVTDSNEPVQHEEDYNQSEEQYEDQSSEHQQYDQNDEQQQPEMDESDTAKQQSTSDRKRKRDSDDDGNGDEGSHSSATASQDNTSKRARPDPNSTASFNGSRLNRPRKPCFDFQRRGQCQRGASCHFEHAPRIPQQQTTHGGQQPSQQFIQQQYPAQQFLNQSFPQQPMQQQGNFTPQQQQWMQQQQMMQLAMQQQYMMQQQQQNRSMINDDETEISLTGPKAAARSHVPSFVSSAPSSSFIQTPSNLTGTNKSTSRTHISHGGLGYHPTAAESSTPAPSVQRFVSASTQDMEAGGIREEKHVEREETESPSNHQEESTNETQQQPSPIPDDEDEANDLIPSTAPKGNAAIPYTYQTPRGGSSRGRGGRGGGRGGRGGHLAGGGPVDSQSTRIYVSHVPKDLCNLVSLSPHFAQFGNVTSLKVLNDSSAIVQMSTHEEAAAAVNSEKAVLGNRFIQVGFSKHDGGGQQIIRPFSKQYQKPSFTPVTNSTVNPLAPPPATEKLSALEVAKAMKKTNAPSPATSTTTNTTDADATATTSSIETDSAKVAPISSTTASVTPTTVTPPATASVVSELQLMKQQLLSKQIAQQKELLARITNEKDTLTITEKQALMAKLSALTQQVNAGKKEMGTTGPHQPTIKKPIAPAAPKLSALEVVAQMKAKQAAAAAAAASAPTTE